MTDLGHGVFNILHTKGAKQREFHVHLSQVSIFLIIGRRAAPYPHYRYPAMNAPAPSPREQMEAFWMPFTANRQFKANPRMLAKAEGMHYWTPEGRQILDAVAGPLVRQRRPRPRARSARRSRSRSPTMEYAPPFQMGHPTAFQLANEVASWLPKDMAHIFFTNSGSESVDTALKIALAYHRARGEGIPHALHRPRARLSRRGLRRHFRRRHGQQPQVVRLDAARASITCPTRTTWRRTPTRAAMPEHGANLADELERIVALHDASNDCGGDRRAGRGLHRRADPAQGLPAAAARDLHQARHPADLRRSHHGLRPPGRAVRHGVLRRARPT